MHETAALTAGASVVAVDEVVERRRRRSFSLAGGMHHAHRARAAGFSVYNDAAVAIAVARRRRPGLKVLYIDIDAHHGDGVQEAFYGSNEVMTISIHESGVYAYPGTGFPSERGYGDGEGYSANVPLPALASDACYRLVFESVVEPLVRAFAPDLIVAQVGVDAHYSDPITDLGLTLPGYRHLVTGVRRLADQLCGGRLVARGGGGYNLRVVPLAWTWVMAELLGRELADELPERWREHFDELLGGGTPASLGERDRVELPRDREEQLLELTRRSIEDVQRELFPLHGLAVP
jgi:acetoin utilization protein AcuC